MDKVTTRNNKTNKQTNKQNLRNSPAYILYKTCEVIASIFLYITLGNVKGKKH